MSLSEGPTEEYGELEHIGVANNIVTMVIAEADQTIFVKTSDNEWRSCYLPDRGVVRLNKTADTMGCDAELAVAETTVVGNCWWAGCNDTLAEVYFKERDKYRILRLSICSAPTPQICSSYVITPSSIEIPIDTFAYEQGKLCPCTITALRDEYSVSDIMVVSAEYLGYIHGRHVVEVYHHSTKSEITMSPNQFKSTIWWYIINKECFEIGGVNLIPTKLREQSCIESDTSQSSGGDECDFYCTPSKGTKRHRENDTFMTDRLKKVKHAIREGKTVNLVAFCSSTSYGGVQEYTLVTPRIVKLLQGKHRSRTMESTKFQITTAKYMGLKEEGHAFELLDDNFRNNTNFNSKWKKMIPNGIIYLTTSQFESVVIVNSTNSEEMLQWSR